MFFFKIYLSEINSFFQHHLDPLKFKEIEDDIEDYLSFVKN